ncbi:hypothetical protein ACPESR_26965 [Nocardia testacea]|uniref:hypothetical protein n=1 Tax=Nocardia testacea TaxID=248551 RepID=UPI003C3033BA
MTKWEQLRALERQQWKLAQGMELRPHARQGLLAKWLERTERERRELREELAQIIARREEPGLWEEWEKSDRWEVHNSPQSIRELRYWEDRRQEGRERLNALKLRREELRGELQKLRGDTTPEGGSVAGRAGDQKSRVDAELRLQDLEVRYDDRTAAGLRDLKGAQRNVEWMVEKQANAQRVMERQIDRLEGKLQGELARQERQSQQVVMAAAEMNIPDRPEGSKEIKSEAKDKAKEIKSEAKGKVKAIKSEANDAVEGIWNKAKEEVKEAPDKERNKITNRAEVEAKKVWNEAEDKAKEVKDEAKGKAKEVKGEAKEKAKEVEDKKREEEAQEKKDKRAANWRSAGMAVGGIAAVAAVAFGVDAAIDSGSEDGAAGKGSEDGAAGDVGSEDGAADTGSEDGAADTGSEDGAADTGSEDGAAGDAGSGSAVADAGSIGAVADSGYMGAGAAVPAGVAQEPALGSGPGSASGNGFDDGSTSDLSERNARVQNDVPSQESFGPDRAALGTPVSGGQGFDAAGLLLPLMLSNLPDPGSADPGPDEVSEYDPDRDRDHDTNPGPATPPATVPPPVQQGVATPRSHQPPTDEIPATDPRQQAGPTAPQSAVPASPTGARDDRVGVVYTHKADGVTERVSASVADAYAKAYSDKNATDAQAAYAGTDAEWVDEKALEPVDPNDLMSGDIITFDNGSAIVRVQNEEGHPEGGEVDVIIKGELTPIGAVMEDGAGELGGFTGFGHPPGIELPVSEEQGAGASVPTPGDQSGDTSVPV